MHSYRSFKSRLCVPALLSVLGALGTLPASAQQAPKPPAPAAEQPKPAAKPDTKPEAKPKPGQPKPYREVITADAKTETGLFAVHRIDDKVYFEIPADKLGREMLWTTEIAKLPAGMGYGGTFAGSRVVRWTRRNNKVYLRSVDHSIRAEGVKGAIETAVEDASLEPIIMAFDVEAEGPAPSDQTNPTGRGRAAAAEGPAPKGASGTSATAGTAGAEETRTSSGTTSRPKTAVIDVTRLLSGNVAEFSASGPLGGGGVDAGRTYIDKVKPFPTNIDVSTVYTFTGGGAPAVFGPGRRFGGGGGGGTVTAEVHYSMVELPPDPMKPRLYDSRVGYFTNGFQDYGRPENRVVEREYIARFRLEKKDPSAALSEPVKPIVYYISREVPEKWHPWLKRGVEAWNAAFEKAGFKNAIVCKDAPTMEEDPDWDADDARYNVIRWAPTETENAMGPHVSDPRTGEIISAHIIVWHNVLKLAETWYFTQVAPLDPRARHLPLPEPLMGEILQYVVCHEVGHTLGLRHNHKASSSYTVDQLRNRDFTDRYGDEASIMDYGRFNYVAQPGDNARLIPILGPYDYFAIEWGYKPLPGAATPDDEKSALDAIAARQMTNPMLRFGGENANAMPDPTVQMEDLGSDPIAATTYGLKNLDRVMAMLVPATTKFGDNYDQLGEMYNAALGQWRTEMFHVVKLVGGVVETDYHAGRGGDVFRPEPPAKQAEAVRFLLAHAFQAPTTLLPEPVLARIAPSGVADRVLGTQRYILDSLLSEDRVKRLVDWQLMTPGSAYTVGQLVSDLQDGIWSELSMPQPAVGLYRRNLQRAYLASMKARLVGDGATQTDLRPIGIGELRSLAHSIDQALPRTHDPVTVLHLQDCRKQIERIVNPRE